MARGRPRDPEVSRKAVQAQELMESEGLSVTAAAKRAGLSAQALRYRLNNPASLRDLSDGLPEDPQPGEIPVFTRDYSDQPDHRTYPIGDLHIGGPAHAGDSLDEWLDYVADTPRVSMLNTGDNTNCAIKSSVSEAYDEQLTVAEARKVQTEKFKPLADADKIDAVIDGNHENRIYRATGDSPNAAVCDALGINYSRAACIVRYLVGDVSYDVYLRHGKGGGSTMGGQVNQLERQERIIDADIYISGHTHTQVAFVKDIFVPNGQGGFTRRKRLFVCSGSFVGYEDYAAEAGYPPAHIGAPRLYLDGRRKDAHASV